MFYSFFGEKVGEKTKLKYGLVEMIDKYKNQKRSILKLFI